LDLNGDATTVADAKAQTAAGPEVRATPMIAALAPAITNGAS
jgi:hypothetical protein